MAIAGTVLSAAVILFVALAAAALAGGILGGSSGSPASLVIPTLLGAAACALLVSGLLRRSRAAYVVTILISAFTVYLWTNLLLGSSASRLEPLPLLSAIPPALVVIGLGISWREFWQSPKQPSAEN